MARKIMTFESNVSDNETLRTLRVAGIYRDGSDNEADVAKGMLCTRNGLTDSLAYAGQKNSNSWYMTAAKAGEKELYAAAPHITDRGVNSNGIVSIFGSNTLAVTSPAGLMIGYEKIMNGYIYSFGAGNFSTEPDLESGKKYATVADGLLVATAEKPESGSYFEVLKPVTFTEGTRSVSGYSVMYIA